MWPPQTAAARNAPDSAFDTAATEDIMSQQTPTTIKVFWQPLHWKFNNAVFLTRNSDQRLVFGHSRQL